MSNTRRLYAGKRQGVKAPRRTVGVPFRRITILKIDGKEREYHFTKGFRLRRGVT